MKVSQLLKVMDKTDLVAIYDANKGIGNNRIYDGEVRGIKRDDPINGYHIHKVFAYDDVVIMEAAEPRMKGGAE
jgi:hypothetical protein